ncbi:MAG TPA: hypothetical protein VH598_16340 [Verrucomicrobiae bacterium]|nr:hypothetical protein [Verrucomicrobiae bacterium]
MRRFIQTYVDMSRACVHLVGVDIVQQVERSAGALLNELGKEQLNERPIEFQTVGDQVPANAGGARAGLRPETQGASAPKEKGNGTKMAVEQPECDCPGFDRQGRPIMLCPHTACEECGQPAVVQTPDGYCCRKCYEKWLKDDSTAAKV